MTELTRKRLILFFIPFLLVTGLIISCWGFIIFSEYFATWQHYIGLLLFTALVFLFIKNRKAGIAGLGIFLLLGTGNLFSLTPAIVSTRLSILSITTPAFSPLCFGLLVLYLIFNTGTLIELELDYREIVRAKRQGETLEESMTDK